MRIIEASPQGTSLELASEPSASYKMILLIIGSAGIGDPEVNCWIASIANRYADVPLVLVSDREDSVEVVAAFEAGVSGFVPTSITPNVALQAFAFIMGGGSFFPPAALIEATRASRPSYMASGRKLTVIASVQKGGLTARQQQVLKHLTQGESNKSIGKQLQLCESTVKVHVRHIMKKLGAANRTQAALSAAYLATPASGSAAAIGTDPTDAGSDR
jgi:DNA-binding NarL/FixJ family response regulator